MNPLESRRESQQRGLLQNTFGLIGHRRGSSTFGEIHSTAAQVTSRLDSSVIQSENHFSLTLNECCGGNPKRLSGPAIEQDGLIFWKQETVRSRWVTDRTSRSKSKPKKARFEVFPKEERPKIGVEPQNPHLREKHPNSPLDLMGDPFHRRTT